MHNREKETTGMRYRIVIRTGDSRQHLNNDTQSKQHARSIIEAQVRDELEALNDTRLTEIAEAIVLRFYAKPDGDDAYVIFDRKGVDPISGGHLQVARYQIHECEVKNSRDGRLRWFYRGYIVNTTSNKTRYAVTKPKAENIDDKGTYPVKNSLTGALALIDALVED